MNRNRRNKRRATFYRPVATWTLSVVHVVNPAAPTRAEIEAAIPLIHGTGEIFR